VLASGGGGELYVDMLKNNRARTVPLVDELVPIVERWSAGKRLDDWLFDAPGGGPLRESNWKRSVGWLAAKAAAGVPAVRVHDPRHTAASLWLGAGADPKVVQRVLGHGTAAMTMDLYGHTWWMPTCGRLRSSSGAPRGYLSHPKEAFERMASRGQVRKTGHELEPPIGIEPMTYALREARQTAPGSLPAQTAAHPPLNAPGAQCAPGSRSTTRSTARQPRRACVPTYRKRRGRRRDDLACSAEKFQDPRGFGSIVLSRLVTRECDQHVGI
jgi:integrase-like protein